VTTHTIKKGVSKPPFFISYLITDPEIFGNTPKKLQQSLTKTFENHNVDMICFRDKTSMNKEELALSCIEIAHKFGIKKVLINSDIELCKRYKFDGIHLNSQQFDLLKILQDSNLYKIISCHTEKQIALAKSYNANAVTYSPIFFKENKGEPKGIENLQNMITKYQDDKFKIVALGGIVSNNDVKKIIETNSFGFASIRYFKI
jgi:thiamine-phosphate pyrophosphorylase